jgi:GT2 family glycosyltransferase
MSKIVIAIVSYNSKRYTQECIDSIRSKVKPDSYLISVVDNASTDGIAEWLSNQPDILLTKNDINRGFGPACNQAVAATIGTEFESADVFILNNDTVMTSTALPRMIDTLYSSDDIGAVGAMANYAGNRQQIDVVFPATDDYVNFGETLQISASDARMEKVRLNGFAMLVRRNVWDAVGGFDEDFAPGYYEDDALSIDILKLGYRLVLSRDSFIYHVGSASFVKTGQKTLSQKHHDLFIRKYGFDILDYVYPCGAVMSQIPFKRDEHFKVMHVGCGLGAELKAIRSFFPNAEVYGIEPNQILFSITRATENVFPSVQDALSNLGTGLFNLLIVDSNLLSSMDESEKESLANMCTHDAIELSRLHDYDDFPFDNIRLVIWDDAVYTETIATHLANWGIMSSVYKSDNLRQRISSYKIPTDRMLLISSDPMLKVSTMMMFPELAIAEPSIVPYLSAHYARLPITDASHTKAKELELFERKRQIEKSFSSHEAFVEDSQLSVSMHINCIDKADDILALLNDSYNLGISDEKFNKAHLMRLLTNKWNECTYITARDKYSDYGVVGFSCNSIREDRELCSVKSWYLNGDDLDKSISSTKIDLAETDISTDSSIQILIKGNSNLHFIEDYLIGGSVTTEYDSSFDYYNSPLPSMLYSSRFDIIVFSLIQEDYSVWEKDSDRKLSELFETLESLCSDTINDPTIILLLGYESQSPLSYLSDGNLAELHSEINPLILDFAARQQRIRTINVTDYINSPDDFDGSVNTFCTRVYSDIVEQIVVFINEKVDELLGTQ